jgi:meso-butanediol dehydrogenase/(S,S)-butanediol dehydrogenase/diacetyl reductase
MDLTERVVLVTGAAAGIGFGVASRFAEAGAAVAVFDIDGPAAQRAAAALPRAIAIQGDVASEADTRAAVARTLAAFGRLDTLVNNAGIELNGTVTEMPPEAWDRQMAVNLRGVFLFSRAAIPAMRGAGGGSIVNIASVHAFVSWPRCPAYDATKAGLIGLTRAMALDHGRDGIRVNAICPGYIDTPMLGRWFNTLDDCETERRNVLAAHPVGRMGTPRDIAEAVLFLASDAASFITGASLVVDGGMTLAGH